MPDLPERRVGIIACSGEEIPEGTVTRLATLEVIGERRPGRTLTICLPLFLAGDEGHRAFVRHHPTITVDGCGVRCAARGAELYSGKPTASIVVEEVAAAAGLPRPHGRRQLDEAGRRSVTATALRITELVDGILGGGTPEAPSRSAAEGTTSAPAVCSCGSGIPVANLTIAGRVVEVVALPPILQQFFAKGREANEATARELLDTVRIYNAVPADAEAAWREAILAEYAQLLAQAGPR